MRIALGRLPPGPHHLGVINGQVEAVRRERKLGLARTWTATVRRVLQDLRPWTTSLGEGVWTITKPASKDETPKVL